MGCNRYETEDLDIVKYEKNEYIFLELPANEFYYDYNGNSHDRFEEVDGIYPINSSRWSMIWNGGDLYCTVESADEAENYYANDENYNWYVLIDGEYDEETNYYVLNLTEKELNYVYGLEEMERIDSVFWQEFKKFGSLVKISKDGIIRGTLSIAQFDGNWYWRSEIIDERRECDGTWPEYIQPLPKSISDKINIFE